MADNLIPEPQIQATNIPTGGGAQVRFDFEAPDNTFANLSKTIASAGQTMVNFNQLEENERKAQESLQEGLAQIHGLTETGQLSEAEYMKIQRELNGKAQSEGIIRANENWFTMTETQKERANIRLKGLESALKTSGAIDRMSNPNENEASKWDDEYNSILESLSGASMGTDSQGNEVYLNLDDMTVMELVQFSKGQSSLEAATKIAVDENKHNRQIEANTSKMQSDLFDVFDNMGNNLLQMLAFGEGDSDIEPFLLAEGARLEDIINIGHNAGVQNINDQVFTSLETWKAKYISKLDPTDVNALENANMVIDFVENRMMLREGHRFAKEGTENYNKVETIRSDIQKAHTTLVNNYEKTLPDREDEYSMFIQNEIRRNNSLPDNDPNKMTHEEFRLYAFEQAGKYGVLHKSEHKSMIDDYFGISEIGDKWNSDPEVYDTSRGIINSLTNINTATYELLRKQISNFYLNKKLSKTDSDALLAELQKNYEATTKKLSDANIEEKDLDSMGEIGYFNAERIDSSYDKMLRKYDGLGIFNIGGEVPLTAEPSIRSNLKSLHAMLFNGVVNGELNIEPQSLNIEDEVVQEFLRGKPALKSAVENYNKILSEGLDLKGTTQELNLKAIEFFKAKAEVFAIIQAARKKQKQEGIFKLAEYQTQTTEQE